MFDITPGESRVLSWRGPMLAVGLFAAVFAILLLMAHQNETDTSDIGSSLREDPYGASLLFDSYGRAGYEVKRSQNEDSLSEQNALRTTAFFIGGHSSDDWQAKSRNVASGKKLGRRVEDFLAHGGRVVLVAPAWKLRSKAQEWEVEDKWNQTVHESGPSWISPDSRTMPAGSEKMYVAAGSPWLQTDAAWTTLYAGPVDPDRRTDSSVHVYMATRRVGNGELIAASQESFLLNEAVKTHPSPTLLDFLAGGRPVVWVDEALHGLRQDEGVLWLVQRYRLELALLLFWATLLALLWSMSGDLVRHPTDDQTAQFIRYSEGAEVATRRLLERSIPTEQVLAECWEEFRRRSPQDAQAIVADRHGGPRLSAALAKSPLAGYREIRQLVAERRGSAKGLARADRDAPASSTHSPKTDRERTRNT